MALSLSLSEDEMEKIFLFFPSLSKDIKTPTPTHIHLNRPNGTIQGIEKEGEEMFQKMFHGGEERLFKFVALSLSLGYSRDKKGERKKKRHVRDMTFALFRPPFFVVFFW